MLFQTAYHGPDFVLLQQLIDQPAVRCSHPAPVSRSLETIQAWHRYLRKERWQLCRVFGQLVLTSSCSFPGREKELLALEISLEQTVKRLLRLRNSMASYRLPQQHERGKELLWQVVTELLNTLQAELSSMPERRQPWQLLKSLWRLARATTAKLTLLQRWFSGQTKV